MKVLRLALILAVTAAVGCAGVASAPADVARAIESQVWSPYCPGRLLSDCTTVQARELRAEIERRVEDGASSEEVLAWIRSDYGESAVARPQSGPAGVVLWLVPALVFAAGVAVVTRFIRRATRGTSTPA